MPKIPECDHCQYFANSPYMVCGVNPGGPKGATCEDFEAHFEAATDEPKEPLGGGYYVGDWIPSPFLRSPWMALVSTTWADAITGYAPSAQAATVLSEEAQIEGNTVARLLHSKDTDTASEKAIWIVDEAGLLSVKDAHALLQKAQAHQARVILVGDTRQLSAVEAGNPFKSLQSAGMNTCYLEESRRQKTDALRAAVVCLAAGEQREGLEQLDRAGMVYERVSSDARHQAITLDYMSLTPEAREKTLILSGTNVERLALTAALQQEGRLGADAFTLRSLRSQDRTTAQLKYACAYDVGDVVVLVRDYRRYGMQRREQYRVQARDLERNQLTLQGPAGKLFVFDPAGCADKTTYAVQAIAIAPGDQLRWTRNEAAPGVRNSQTVSVEAIDAEGTATLTLEMGAAQGGTMTLELSGQQYLDYALVNTTYSSQGKTADQVLADIDSTLSKEGLYVAVSRAKSNLKLYTADKPQLYKRAQRSAAKENPSDYLTLFEMVNPDTREVRGADQPEHIGASAGERLEVSHRAAVRRDRAVAAGGEQIERTAGSLSRGVRADAAESHRAATDASGQLVSAASRSRAQLEQDGKRRRRRQVYERYAARYVGKSDRECDLLVVKQMMGELLTESGRQSLGEQELQKVGAVLLQGPVAQELKRTQGKEAGLTYADEVLVKARKAVEQVQQRKQSHRRSRDQGMEL